MPEVMQAEPTVVRAVILVVAIMVQVVVEVGWAEHHILVEVTVILGRQLVNEAGTGAMHISLPTLFLHWL
jgi:hypothetical protein